MADLPMAQIPNFSLGGGQLPTPNIGQNVSQGFVNGVNAGQGQQQVAIAQQQANQQAQLQQAQIKQMQVEKNMKMLETGSDMMLSGGPEVQETGKALIQQAYPFLTGQPLPQGMPLDKDAAKDLGYFMDQHRTWQDTQGKEGLSASDAVTGATQAMSRYGMKYQQQQMGLLEKSPMYKEAMANQVGGQVNGQPAVQNSYTGDVTSPNGQAMPGAQGSFIDAGQAASLGNSNKTTIAADFDNATKDNQEVLTNGANVLNGISHVLPPNPTPQEKREFALADKQALVKYAQMIVPSSKRPPNMTMEEMAKSGIAGEKVKELYNNITDNAPMSNEERESLMETVAKTALENESQLSTREQAIADRAKRNGVNPAQAISNIRPSGIPSTSQYFPDQGPGPVSTWKPGQIIMGASGPQIYRGGDPTQKSSYLVVQ